MPDTPDADELAPELLSLLLPLHYFYAKEERPLPDVQLLDGNDVPEPEKSLLVHARDMTSTLTKFHGSPISLSVLTAEQTDDYVMRMVVLHREDSNAPVRVRGNRDPPGEIRRPAARTDRQRQRPSRFPVGKYIVDYRSCPKGYFSMPADPVIAAALEEEVGATVYGRCNELTDPEGFAFADIVEVLPRASN